MWQVIVLICITLASVAFLAWDDYRTKAADRARLARAIRHQRALDIRDEADRVAGERLATPEEMDGNSNDCR